MNHIEIIIDSGLDESELNMYFDFPRNNLVIFCANILEKIDADNWEMGLIITNDMGIHKLNRKWRKRDEPTDVLSFVHGNSVALPVHMHESEYIPMGDVVISFQTVMQNAHNRNITFDEELRRVIIHGILHLKGLEHAGDDYENGMLKMQEILLNDSKGFIELK